MLHNFDLVALAVTLPEYDLLPGALGTVLEVYTEPRITYNVEFGASDGGIMPLVTLDPEQVQKLGR
ncbi:DUF4926 domain-containing protein [Kineosporia sp. NBRC 101731]|uniref:DUF4926 domain-containing protein n=1 Tax=Kineosporia sp. NBRC 101731 TaxID=3032199 RepID=UPI0024A59D8E|nr:DUF4926 domain-containing protein [Kineosporia sp. NBRC 101731]GLY27257.1 hypothetical protein Kisp02_06220 [Kineosporia sp. NBRC 101731]